MVDKILIIGVGLIGASIAKALKAKRLARRIFGYGRNIENLEKARQGGVIDDYLKNLDNIGADVIFISVPLGGFQPILQNLEPSIQAQTIITDVGSAKSEVMKIAHLVLGDRAENFIPAHPIAGGETSGLDASSSELFVGKKVILTPDEKTDKEKLRTVEKIWRAIGADVEIMAAAEHDNLLAMTSHLPHILAFSLMDYLSENHPDACDYAAGGFKDFSRIASSDAQMWRDICLQNAPQILRHIEKYQNTLDKFQNLIAAGDAEKIEQLFAQAKKTRDDWLLKNS